ncbi:hypothetical protein ACQUSR_19110 [Streptomyces sp. P1-3]|uniref:hypothetical protein n=1 Tax=Streptomyces sp. P1-3 TaxID=3421658 RepID=UPI003D369D79
MAIGIGGAREEEAPVPAVEWARVREFTMGTVERPATAKRARPVRGPRAIRVPKGAGSSQVFAPCVYIAPPAPPAPAGAVEPCLFEDPESQRLLCYLVADGEVESEGERRFQVCDGQGQEIGTIRRIPSSKRMFKHTWRIHQPGQAEVVGRNQWASGDAKRIAERGAGKVFTDLLNSVASGGAEGGDQGSPIRKSRTLEWWADGQLVMVSEGTKLVTIKAEWLDRRLAFAFALLGDR